MWAAVARDLLAQASKITVMGVVSEPATGLIEFFFAGRPLELETVPGSDVCKKWFWDKG